MADKSSGHEIWSKISREKRENKWEGKIWKKLREINFPPELKYSINAKMKGTTPSVQQHEWKKYLCLSTL